MRTYDTKDWTVGCELEWPDVDVFAPLSKGWSWSTTDYSIVNSDGVANDPKRKLIFRGGELNSPPFASADALSLGVAMCWFAMNPGHNYRSNFHVHVKIPHIERDVPALRQIAEYTRANLRPVIDTIDPLDGLLLNQPNEDALYAARQRLNHSQMSRHYFTTDERHSLRYPATTLEQFLAAEVPISRSGVPQWHLASREAVNLRSLRKHGTIEFRMFADPDDYYQARAAAMFAIGWLRRALENKSCDQLIEWSMPRLPRQRPFNHRLEKGWQLTNLHTNSRQVVLQRLQNIAAYRKVRLEDVTH